MYKIVNNAPCLESLIIMDGALKELSVKADFGDSCALKVPKDISNAQEFSIYERTSKNLDAASNLSCPYSIS